tara:strand:+ start:3352 stop:4209 length:858 start_codon:yes stop_codon:yes gene_type:complete
MPSEHILSVNDLRLELHPPSLSQPPRQILDGVTFDLARGSSLAILGRTASGKSLLLRAITRFFHELPVRSVEGEIWFEGKNLLRTSNQKLLNIRGARIAYILQNAHQNFNARLSIRQHFDILLRFNRPKIKDRAAHAIFYLYKVGILDPEALIEKRCFPVELDIETRQLVMIASALACEPRLLIMDEPAAEFDSNTVAHLVDMLEDLKLERGMSVLMGTGRVRRAEQFADLIAVLEKGELVEIATPRQLFESGREDATRAFVDGTLLAGHERERLVAHYYHSRSD